MQTNYPSVKTIMTCGVDRGTATLIKTVFTMKRGALNEIFEVARARTAECYNPPGITDLRLTVIDSLLGTYGTEGIEVIARNGDFKGWLEYCNAGDTYNTTVLYYEGRFSVGCWGDIVERFM